MKGRETKCSIRCVSCFHARVDVTLADLVKGGRGTVGPKAAARTESDSCL